LNFRFPRYSLNDGASSFAEQARGATFDLTNDEVTAERKKRQMRWDKKKKKFIKGDGGGADNVKLVKTENGTRLPASYRSGRFDEWKTQNRISLPKIGEMEEERQVGVRHGDKRFKHHKITPAKPIDKLRTDYGRKVKRLKKQEGDAGEGPPPSVVGKKKGRYGGQPIGRVKSELKTREQIRKGRKIKDKRKAKNARPKRVKKGRR
jgi:ATP-dependent RNA helicase DDX54/DBP10